MDHDTPTEAERSGRYLKGRSTRTGAQVTQMGHKVDFTSAKRLLTHALVHLPLLFLNLVVTVFLSQEHQKGEVK